MKAPKFETAKDYRGTHSVTLRVGNMTIYVVPRLTEAEAQAAAERMNAICDEFSRPETPEQQARRYRETLENILAGEVDSPENAARRALDQ